MAATPWIVATIANTYPVDFLRSNPYIIGLMSYVHEIKENDNAVLENYSCFNLPPYFQDLFIHTRGTLEDLFDDDNRAPIRVEPSYVYYIATWSHVATIIYLNKDEIYYVDFYSETDRPESFRFERLTPEIVNTYLENCRRNDIEGYLRFHNAGADLRSELYSVIPDNNLLDEVKRAKITIIPWTTDMLRVVLHPSADRLGPNENIDYDLEDSGDDPDRQLDGYRILAGIKMSWVNLMREVDQ